VIRIGEPLTFPHFDGQHEDPAALRTVTDAIMRELQKLSRQEYIDRYSPGPATPGAASRTD
jgi:1-acyl-sn-glycerol-3-phosphate acyltransferase